MPPREPIWFAALIALVGYLGVSVLRRWRAARRKERQWPGRPLDVTLIAPHLEQVRANYLQLIHPRPTSHRKELLALARSIVAAFPYFRTKAENPRAKSEE